MIAVLFLFRGNGDNSFPSFILRRAYATRNSFSTATEFIVTLKVTL